MNLCDQYKLMHEQGAFKGYSLLPHVEDIAKLVKKYDAKTLLDYGCGKGLQYTEKRAHDAWGGIMPTLYDPHVEGLNIEPKNKFDGIICTDVLEHVPEDEVKSVLRKLMAYRREFGFIFITICTRPAKKTLPDGRNCHLTIKSKEWWLDTIFRCATDEEGWEHKDGDIYFMCVTGRQDCCERWYVKFVE